jgi:aspartyl-tRNA(Asn)/glutamyl-tRNA(Gln) amidotransferase subunit C
MSKISISEIEKVAKLSRIEIEAESIDSLAQEFSSILEFVETIQNAKTDGIEPTSQVTGLNDVWREDRVVNSQTSSKELLASAPEVLDGYVKVKKVL